MPRDRTLFLAGLLALAALGCESEITVETSQTGAPGETAVDTMRREVAAGEAVLVDVRSEEEWAEGHAAAATHLPIAALSDGVPEAEAAGVPKDKTVYTYCKAGGRAKRAAAMLEEAGYDAVPLAEGFEELKAAGVEAE